MAQPIPNISFLGKTFNYIKLDPMDPEKAALTTNAFKLDLSNETPDRQWQYPQGATYTPRSGGSVKSKFIERTSINKLSTEFSNTTKVHVGVPLVASGKASTTYTETSEQIFKHKN